MGVPILRIPVVALRVLLDCMNDVELVTVSLLSKRADWFLKICGKKNVSFFNLEGSKIRYLSKIQTLELFLLENTKQGVLPRWDFELSCSVSCDLHISISCNTFDVSIYFEALEDFGKFVGVRRNLKIGKWFVSVVITKENHGVEKIRTFWNNKANGMIAFMDCFKDILNVSIEHLKFSGEDTNSIKRVVNHINSTQTVVKNVRVELHPPLFKDAFKFILRNVSATESFYSNLNLRQSFKLNGMIRAKNIYVENGHWFTLRNLLNSDENERITVHKSDFRKVELRKFLRQWKLGKFPKLKEVNLATKVSYSDVTSSLVKRPDKCDNTRGQQVEAFRGHGNSYATVCSVRNEHRYNTGGRQVQSFWGEIDVRDIAYPDQSGNGYFCMFVHNS